MKLDDIMALDRQAAACQWEQMDKETSLSLITELTSCPESPTKNDTLRALAGNLRFTDAFVDRAVLDLDQGKRLEFYKVCTMLIHFGGALHGNADFAVSMFNIYLELDKSTLAMDAEGLEAILLKLMEGWPTATTATVEEKKQSAEFWYAITEAFDPKAMFYELLSLDDIEASRNNITRMLWILVKREGEIRMIDKSQDIKGTIVYEIVRKISADAAFCCRFVKEDRIPLLKHVSRRGTGYRGLQKMLGETSHLRKALIDSESAKAKELIELLSTGYPITHKLFTDEGYQLKVKTSSRSEGKKAAASAQAVATDLRCCEEEATAASAAAAAAVSASDVARPSSSKKRSREDKEALIPFHSREGPSPLARLQSVLQSLDAARLEILKMLDETGK